MNIFHLYAQDYNIGDHLLAYGTQLMFLKWFDSRSLFRSFDIHHTVVDQAFVDRVNAEADLLLVGGGGLIHGIDRWMLNIKDEMIEKIKKPIIIFGVGYNFFRGESGLFSPILKQSLELINAKALSFSVRNDGSHEKLLEHDLCFPEIPDPGFFLDQIHKIRFLTNKDNFNSDYVVIQLANDVRGCRGINEEFNASMAALIETIAYEYKVILMPHLEVDEWLNKEIYSLVNHFPNVHPVDFHHSILRGHLSSVISLYAGARFVVGMRGHAQICPFGLGVPVITLASHDKIMGLAEKTGQEYLCVDIQDPNMKDELIKRAEFLMDDDNLLKVRKYNAEIITDIQSQGEEFVRGLKERFGELQSSKK